MSKKLSFTITSIGFSKKIIFRNKAKLNDDIYVTGNLGDSYIGLRILKKEIKLNKNSEKYFKKKYFLLYFNLSIIKKLPSIANTSIYILDSLITNIKKVP